MAKRVTLKDVSRVDWEFGEYIREFARNPEWTNQDIACFVILDIYLYDNQGRLPNDEKRLAALCRLDVEDFCKSWVRIEPHFKLKLNEIYRKRIIFELRAARRRIQTSVNNGVKGGRPRKPTGLPQDTHSLGNTNTNTNTNTKKKKESPYFKNPPTIEEINAYIEANKYPVDGAKFLKYFTEGDWKDKKGDPVLNWKQKIITWSGSRSGTKNNQSHSGKSGKRDFSNQTSEYGQIA